MNTETLVSVDNVSRNYGDHCAVDNLSFTVKRGEVLGFLGPNGAGKSTTMQIICGVLAPSEGSVSIAGNDIIDNAQEAKKQLGFLPERPPLYTDLKVDEYLLYCAALRNIPGPARQKALENARQRCGLEDHGSRLINNLSKGYQQRVGIAQAIIHSPAVVILDEPSSGLDPIQITEIRKLISELGEDHSVILSTHILPEVQSSCDRVLIIDQGKLVLDENLGTLGSSEKLCNISIAMRRPPLPEELSGLDGVLQVETLDAERFRICAAEDAYLAERLVAAAVENDWGLYELIPESDSLENTFLRLTRGELIQTAPTGEEP